MPSGARVFVASVVQAHRFFQIHFLTFRLFSFCLIEEKKWGFSLCKTLLFPICLQHVLPTSGQKWRTDLSTHASIAGQNNPEADPKTTKNRWLLLFFSFFLSQIYHSVMIFQLLSLFNLQLLLSRFKTEHSSGAGSLHLSEKRAAAGGRIDRKRRRGGERERDPLISCFHSLFYNVLQLWLQMKTEFIYIPFSFLFFFLLSPLLPSFAGDYLLVRLLGGGMITAELEERHRQGWKGGGVDGMSGSRKWTTKRKCCWREAMRREISICRQRSYTSKHNMNTILVTWFKKQTELMK